MLLLIEIILKLGKSDLQQSEVVNFGPKCEVLVESQWICLGVSFICESRAYKVFTM